VGLGQVWWLDRSGGYNRQEVYVSLQVDCKFVMIKAENEILVR